MQSGPRHLLPHRHKPSCPPGCMKNPYTSVGKEAIDQTDPSQGRSPNGQHVNRSLGDAATVPTEPAPANPVGLTPPLPLSKTLASPVGGEHKRAQEGLHFSPTQHPRPVPCFSCYEKNTTDWGA